MKERSTQVARWSGGKKTAIRSNLRNPYTREIEQCLEAGIYCTVRIHTCAEIASY